MDAQTIAFGHSNETLFHATGFDRVSDLVDEFEGWTATPANPWFVAFLEKIPIIAASTHSDAWFEKICHLFLEILQDPQGASDRALATVWVSMNWAINSRPTVAFKMLDAGILELAIAGVSLP